jgi:hypothetical protein
MNFLFEILVNAYAIQGYEDGEAYQLAEEAIKKFSV